MIGLKIGTSIVLACIPSLIWLSFFLREDTHAEPKRLLFYTFAAGAFVSLFVLAVQYAFQETVLALSGGAALLIVGLALIEEVFKFSAAYWSIAHDPHFKEPIDAMIYMITAALGFATVENLFALSGSFSGASLASLGAAVSTLGLRFMGATFLHTLAAGIIGYYWARGAMRGKVRRGIAIGLVLATAVHAAFNYLIATFQNANLLIYPSLFLLSAAFFVLIDFERLKVAEKAERESAPR